MAEPLLETKLHPPRRRPGLVARPRLHELLARSSTRSLTLASAPAGFGKTTLLADWLHAATEQGHAVAWVSLDERDNEPSSFWTYVATGLERTAPAVASGALAVLQTGSFDAFLAALLNDMLAADHRVAIVLDDYHLIEAPELHEQLTYLVEHLPPNGHVLLATRSDPPLPIARLRARGDLVEVRAADLRFTEAEAATYLASLRPDLEAAQVETLVERTEGWIAALQLAGLSVQGRDDVAAFLADFAGDDRFVVDYLVAEVLQRQPDALHDFLMRTSILRRMSGPLCDAVTGRSDGQGTLEQIERANLFVVPLDERRQWFRYHHLFAEMLRVRLVHERPEELAGLHRSASHWFRRQGDFGEAIHHAFAADDVEEAADLIELAATPLRRARQEATLRRWLERLPEDLFRDRPVLSTIMVGVLMTTGGFDGVEARLADAERWLDGSATSGPGDGVTGPLVADEAEFRRLPSQVAVYRAAQSRIQGDHPGTIAHALRAMELADPDDHLGQGSASGLLGLAHWTLGDLDGAHHHYARAAASLRRAGHLPDVLGCTLALGDILVAKGRLGAALSTYESGLALAAETNPALRGVADMHVGIAEVLIARDDLDGALTHLEASAALGPTAHLAQHPYRWRCAKAAIRRAEGDLDAAAVLLDEADRLFDSDLSPPTRPVAATRARLHLEQGDLAAAVSWAEARGLTADDDLDYVSEYDHVTLAMVLFAQHVAGGADDSLRTALDLLDRLLLEAESGGRSGSMVEILLLASRCHEAAGDVAAARTALARARSLAEPESFARPFVVAGAAPTKRVVPSGTRAAAPPSSLGNGSTTLGAPLVMHGLAAPLSTREMDVLRLLRTRLSGPEIAQELHVSLNTLRTHTKHIYQKLGSTSRRETVERATELGL